MTAHVVTDQEKKLTVWALAIVFLLGALDQTIVSTAMPRIIEQMKGLELYAWVTTTYMLASTVMVPIYGKLGDIYGRKKILLISICIFLVGSMLCGLAGEFGDLPLLGSGMVQLVIFRALQGLGGAGLFSTAFSIIVDLFTPRERGKFMGMFGGIFGIASAIGPLVGGFLTDHGTVTLGNLTVAGWRWVFYVNLPLGLLSLFVIIAKMPSFHHKGTSKIDFLGGILFIASIIPLLLALTWGGNDYAWGSSTIIGMLAAAAVFLALFILVETRVADPLLPLSLFKNRVFSVSNIAGFLIGMSFLGVIVFLPLFTQIVQGQNATNSGLITLPMMIGMIISSSGGGRLVTKTGVYKPYILGGQIILVAGTFWLWQIDTTTTPIDLGIRLFVVGFGLGPAQSFFNLAVSNAVPITQIGISTAAGQFFRQMGSVVGLALFGTLLTHNLSTELPKHVPAVPGMAQSQKMDLSQAQSQAMNPHRLQDDMNKVVDIRFAQIEKAYNGDDLLQQEILKDPRLPSDVKTIVRDRPAAGETPLVTVRRSLQAQADALVATVDKGIKTTFSISITRLLGISFWVLLLAFAVACFLPVLPLRNISPAQERAQKAAEAAAGPSV